MDATAAFIRQLPKAELHVHIEGTLEPELMFEMAVRNGVELPFADAAAVRRAYDFTNLQSFLDIYYEAARVLLTERDFYDLMAAYLRRAVADGIRRAEIFFDPQTHTARGVGFEVFMPGFLSAIADVEAREPISAGLILCFLRHLPAADAEATFELARPYWGDLLGVGLDSSEVGFPPEPFAPVYRRAAAAGLRRVAHAGEEGPPAYVKSALEVLGAERIDHGVRAIEDADLLAEIIRRRIPLTMCPLSNVKLRVFGQLRQHNLKTFLDRGALVTVNSDDPAYFGGYVGANYAQAAAALELSRRDLAVLARNSIEASFLERPHKERLIAEIDGLK